MQTAVDRFIVAQARLLQETGVQGRSRFFTIQEKAARVHNVHVLEGGREGAPPVVWLHGGNSVAATWAPLLHLLQEEYHFFAPDRPGCGLTDGLDYRGVSVREHAVAFVKGVFETLGLERASLVGNSMGGYWALLFALAYPQRVERLVLVGEPAGSARRPSVRHRLLSLPVVNQFLYATVLKPRRERTRSQMKMLLAHPERVSEVFLDVVHAAAVLPGAQRAWLSLLEEVMPRGQAPKLTYALQPELPQVRCPTFFIWGAHDFCAHSWGQPLCQLMPQAHLEILSDAGHLAWLDAPERVADLVRSFLGGSETDSSLALEKSLQNP